jgi:Family of unknown function (DUF5681)
MVAPDQQGEPTYEIGYKRPPKETQFKPGQRGNPRGRPAGSPNLKTVVERALRKKIPVRRGDKTSNVMMLEAIAETYALKAAQGDRHAAVVVINLATKTGVLAGRNDASQSKGTEGVELTVTSARPSAALVESVDPNLLSREEQIELSKLAERIDDAGDAMALDDGDWLRLKQVVSKGRGQGFAPQVDDSLREAA